MFFLDFFFSNTHIRREKDYGKSTQQAPGRHTHTHTYGHTNKTARPTYLVVVVVVVLDHQLVDLATVKLARHSSSFGSPLDAPVVRRRCRRRLLQQEKTEITLLEGRLLAASKLVKCKKPPPPLPRLRRNAHG